MTESELKFLTKSCSSVRADVGLIEPSCDKNEPRFCLNKISENFRASKFAFRVIARDLQFCGEIPACPSQMEIIHVRRMRDSEDSANIDEF